MKPLAYRARLSMTKLKKWVVAILLAQPFYYVEIRIVHTMLSAARAWWRLIFRTRTGQSNPP
jgi:hypothetical protein